MSEHPGTWDLLGPYVMGTLEPHEEREVEDHLEGCANCRTEAQELRLAHEHLADLACSTETPPEDLKARIVAGIPPRESNGNVAKRGGHVACATSGLFVFSPV